MTCFIWLSFRSFYFIPSSSLNILLERTVSAEREIRREGLNLKNKRDLIATLPYSKTEPAAAPNWQLFTSGIYPTKVLQDYMYLMLRFLFPGSRVFVQRNPHRPPPPKASGKLISYGSISDLIAWLSCFNIYYS